MIIEKGLTFDDVLIKPGYSDIASRSEISLSQDFLGFKLDVPIISANMDYVTETPMALAMRNAGGLGILHRFYKSNRTYEDEIYRLVSYGAPIAFSVGVRDIQESVVKVNNVFTHYAANKLPIIVCIDVAHGHHAKVGDLITRIRALDPSAYIIAGNVATIDGAMFLSLRGADAIKVGIGPGSVCTTREVAGVGVPQLSAIMNVYKAFQNIPEDFNMKRPRIIADGGIRSSGDIVKALAAGADAVMLGHLLAGHQECPGEPLETPEGRRFKPYRGQSIFGSNGLRFTPEGVSGFVEERGPVKDTIRRLAEGIRSGLSYVGARNLEEFREIVQFIEVSPSTLHESRTRVITTI